MDILELIKSDFTEAHKIITATDKKKIIEYRDEYRGGRKIGDRDQVGKRPDKEIGSGATKKTVITAKIPFAFQKKVVKTAVAFLFGSPVNLTPNEESDDFAYLKKTWNSLRMDNLLKKFAKAVKSETEATLIFYLKDAPEGSENKLDIKARLLTADNGQFYPSFDQYGDLVAFAWDFTGLNEEGKDVPMSWVYTAEKIYRFEKASEGWKENNSEANPFKKIPVVYMNQREPEWWDVRKLIDRYEMSFSKFCDTNDYFGAPLLKLFGEVKGMPDKQDQGKALRIPQVYKDGKLIKSGDAEYLTWPHAPESTKLEIDISDGLIHSLTDTPDLSFNNVKGVGNISGIALELMFMGAILKAKDSEGDYSVVIDRVLNVIKAGITNAVDTKKKFEDLEISKEFTSVLPDNLLETIQILTEATGGKPTLSQERGARLNPLTIDGDLDVIKKESVSEMGESQI